MRRDRRRLPATPLLAGQGAGGAGGNVLGEPDGRRLDRHDRNHRDLDLTNTGIGRGIEILGGGACTGAGGFSDIGEGAQVVVSDDTGHTLTIVHLGAGSGTIITCSFPFTATVPAGKGFYGISVSHRGVVKFSEAEVPSAALSLGD